eukprot:COSAG02_NODE_1339_length_13187_cov_610.871027_6_plen_53_part_00
MKPLTLLAPCVLLATGWSVTIAPSGIQHEIGVILISHNSGSSGSSGIYRYML